jgi:putative OPT family oligopeptide transporter
MRELSLLAVILGVVIGAALAAANAFVGLKVGMTISASIPAAVMSLLVLRTLLRRGTILESNIVQTVGSAGESLAAGMIFTIPALFIMGQDATFWEMVLWGGIGGMLGALFMIPLRQVLIVREHGVLPYPEGVACAEVLASGERGGAGARPVIWGTLAGGSYYLWGALGAWPETAILHVRRFRTEVQLDSSPALLGVGYILGARVSAMILAGAVIAWFMLIPAVAFFGDQVPSPVFPATETRIADMSPKDIWENYIRYIGAGAVAIGGLISLIKSIKTIASSFWHILASVVVSGREDRDRTEKDLSFVLLILMVIGLGAAMWYLPEIRLDHVGVIAVLIFTFFFVTVSSRLVGIVGSSSNPISGMTIATLLATALVYKFFVVDRNPEITESELTTLKITCLSVCALVAMAIAVAGDTSQDLKTGFLVRATPWKQEIGKMIGVLTSVVAVAGVVLLLAHTYGFQETEEHKYPLLAPQANIMKILVEGVLGGNVPWTLILIGGSSAVVMEMLGIPSLAVAVGMYLPLGLSTPMMVGGAIRWWVERRKGETGEHDPGVLTSSGLVAGQGLMGVTLAGIAAFVTWKWNDPHWLNPLVGKEERVMPQHLFPWIWQRYESLQMKWGLSEAWWDALSFAPFILLMLWLWLGARKRLYLEGVSAVAAGPPQPVMPREQVDEDESEEEDPESSGPLSDYDDPFGSQERET